MIQSKEKTKKRWENKHQQKGACINCKTITYPSILEKTCKNLRIFTILFIIGNNKFENVMLILEYFINVMYCLHFFYLLTFTTYKCDDSTSKHENHTFNGSSLICFGSS